MPWTNPPTRVYHGCDDQSADSITTTGIDLAYCRDRTDFGRGFYTTTILHQARNWANERCRLKRKATPGIAATVLVFEPKRSTLAALHHMCFVTDHENSDYWTFVAHCRNKRGFHDPHGHVNYDVVYGPVTLWRQRLVIKDCDQVSFHTMNALQALGPVVDRIQTRSLFR